MLRDFRSSSLYKECESVQPFEHFLTNLDVTSLLTN